MRLLGIDPGSRLTGFGVIELNKRQLVYLTCGCIRTSSADMPMRLKEIFDGVDEVITEFQPTELAIEKVFVNRNVDSAMKLGHARGAAIVAAVNRSLSVYEYSPNEVKKAVVGRGHADKEQVQHMVKMLLGLPAAPRTDAADALAMALCHAHIQQSRQAMMK